MQNFLCNTCIKEPKRSVQVHFQFNTFFVQKEVEWLQMKWENLKLCGMGIYNRISHLHVVLVKL